LCTAARHHSCPEDIRPNVALHFSHASLSAAEHAVAVTVRCPTDATPRPFMEGMHAACVTPGPTGTRLGNLDSYVHRSSSKL
jgi:hypothetical protein